MKYLTPRHNVRLAQKRNATVRVAIGATPQHAAQAEIRRCRTSGAHFIAVESFLFDSYNAKTQHTRGMSKRNAASYSSSADLGGRSVVSAKSKRSSDFTLVANFSPRSLSRTLAISSTAASHSGISC